MCEFVLEEDTYEKLSKIVIKYLGREPESETLQTKITLIFGLNETCTLILKTVEESSYITKGEDSNTQKYGLIKVKGNIIRFIYKKKTQNLTTGNTVGKIHISTEEITLPKELLEFPKICIREFETLTTQTIMLSCIERETPINEYKSQLNTLNRLIDVYSDVDSICWCIWLYLTEVFSHNGNPVEKISTDIAEEMLINGIPVTLTMRMRIITRMTDEILDKLEEYSLLGNKLRPKYGNTFEEILIPRGDYVTIINFLTKETVRINWNQVIFYLNRGSLYPLVLSDNLGEVM